MNNIASWIEPSSGLANVPLSTERVLAVARGFLLLFWSIPLSVVLALGVVQIPFITQLRVPTYILSLCVGYAGLLFLRKGGALTPRWLGRTRDAMILLLVQVYLAPFSHWWMSSPQSGYYTANMLAIVVIGAWLFYTLDLLAAEWARVMRNTEFRIESELAAWTSVVAALLPSFSVLAKSLAAFSSAEEWPLAAHGLSAPWLRRLELLYPYPFVVTALVMWKARSLALRRCTTAAGKTDAGHYEKSS